MSLLIYLSVHGNIDFLAFFCKRSLKQLQFKQNEEPQNIIFFTLKSSYMYIVSDQKVRTSINTKRNHILVFEASVIFTKYIWLRDKLYDLHS